MRLGAQAVELSGNLHARAYSEPSVNERHRHRYEVNNHFRLGLEEVARRLGTYQEGRLVEIIELPTIPGSSPASSIRSSSRGRGRATFPRVHRRRASRTRARRGVAAEQARVPA